MQRRVPPSVRLLPVLSLVLMLIALTVLALAPSALALSGFKHATAQSESACAAGCHADAAPTNATCTSCHTGYKASGTQKCWDCHKPGQSMASAQLLAGCTTTCHVSTTTGDKPSYTTATFTHSPTAHLGASGYGKTCVTCHSVSTSSTAPGTSPHHDAVNSAAPACAGCHNGAIASSPSGHSAYGADCTSCHTGMDRPSGDCASCHTGRPGSTTPQIAYTNTLACADAGCHGKVTNHAGTPISSAPCTTCHTAHYGALGTCTKCHPDPATFHHGTATARPLADCAGCHNGGIAAAPAGHSGYGTTCTACHTGMDRPAGDCASCHVGNSGGTMPQITYTNTLACADAGCHGKVTNHTGTPIASVACTTCHTAHYQTLGTCETCHPQPRTFHHGASTARPLVECAGCHDGTIASAKAAHAGLSCTVCHSGMEKPAVPAVCSQCHLAKRVGTATCTACHSSTGMTGREQIHTASPKAGLTCTTCHPGHNEDLGACTSCHGLVPEAHHGVAAVSGSTITLQAQPAVLRPGEAGAVSGTLSITGGAVIGGAQVLLQARLSGAPAFTDVQTLVTGADGSFSLPVQPAAAMEYRAVYRGTSSATGATVQRPALAAVTVPVGQSVKLGARPKSARVGQRVKLTGVAAPTVEQLGIAAQAVSLRVERKLGARWVKVASARRTPAADGSFSWIWRPKKPGTYRVTASLAATTALPAVSAQTKIRVR
jgi:hypothetical protein